MSISLTITNRTRRTIDTRLLKHELLRVLKLLGVQTAEWSVTIVKDREMISLHDRTMGIPTTTDVLTFDLRDRPAKKPAEGDTVELDTVLCGDEANRRAKKLGHTRTNELLLYAIHSLLHVQGYDDLRAIGAARMHRREDALLIALGVGAVYRPTGLRDKRESRHSRLETRP